MIPWILGNRRLIVLPASLVMWGSVQIAAFSRTEDKVFAPAKASVKGDNKRLTSPGSS